MSESRSDPGYYRTKAGHMRRLANQAQNETARSTYLLLEASWLRLAESSEKKSDQTARDAASADSEKSAAWSSAAAETGGNCDLAAK